MPPGRLNNALFRFFAFLMFLMATTLTSIFVASQQQPLQPLGDVLHMVLDQDKNQKVTMEEVESQMKILEQLFQEGEEGNEYLKMLEGSKRLAPLLFQLMDKNGDDALTLSELRFLTQFEKSMKKDGGLRNFVRSCFAIVDANGDEQWDVDELLAAIPSTSKQSPSDKNDSLSQMAAKFHEVFPALRPTAKELEGFIRSVFQSIGGSSGKDGGDNESSLWTKEQVSTALNWFDDNGDGIIQKTEVGKVYNAFGKKFLEIAKTIKQMGPMLALFGGGMGDMGGNSMKTEF